MSPPSNNLIATTSNVLAVNSPIPESFFPATLSDYEITHVVHVFAEGQAALAKLTVDTHNRAQWLAGIKGEWENQRQEQLYVEKVVQEQEEVDRREESRKMNLEVHGQSHSSGFD